MPSGMVDGRLRLSVPSRAVVLSLLLVLLPLLHGYEKGSWRCMVDVGDGEGHQLTAQRPLPSLGHTQHLPRHD